MLRNHRLPTTLDLRTEFYAAPPEALLPRKTVAAGLNLSRNWLEQQAIRGGFVPYIKLRHRCLYKKSDVLTWVETHGKRMSSTSELPAVAS